MTMENTINPKKLFWTNFYEYIKVNPCAIEFATPSSESHQIAYLKGYDLQVDLCVNKKTEENKWITRVELYGIKSQKQVARYNYFKSQLEAMKRALPDYEVDFRKVKEDEKGLSWKLYVGTNDLKIGTSDDVEIYKFFAKAVDRFAKAWKPFFEPYKE